MNEAILRPSLKYFFNANAKSVTKEGEIVYDVSDFCAPVYIFFLMLHLHFSSSLNFGICSNLKEIVGIFANEIIKRPN